MPPIILGSKSPRRLEILEFFALPIEQRDAAFDETCVPFHGDPAAYVCAIARGKAAALATQLPHRLILTADTEVYRNGKIFGKPKNADAAVAMLQELAGHWHSVYTGITLRRGAEEYTLSEETRVLFHPATEKHLRLYVNSIHSLDKAGGYAIQQNGSVLVQRIEGCYYNVMGMPVNTLTKLLHHVGIDLWEHLG
jgi:septum formation protein